MTTLYYLGEVRCVQRKKQRPIMQGIQGLRMFDWERSAKATAAAAAAKRKWLEAGANRERHGSCVRDDKVGCNRVRQVNRAGSGLGTGPGQGIGPDRARASICMSNKMKWLPCTYRKAPRGRTAEMGAWRAARCAAAGTGAAAGAGSLPPCAGPALWVA